MEACAPFDDEFEIAGDAVKRAEEARRIAERKLDESGLRGRRQARTELASANEHLAEAHEQLAQAKENSRRPDDVRAAARHDLQAARHELSNHDMFERWQFLPEHLEAIEKRIDALDTWHDWANGKPLDRDRLVAALTSLREHASHEPVDGTQLLVDATHRWAVKQGIDLQPARQPPLERTGIELDL
jgi:hypothetical protein